MSNYTEGPWFVRSGTGLIIKAKNRVIACASLSPKDDWDKAKANARLIAAAPELLNALEKILSWNDEALSELLSECEITDARYAIAKAKGEV